MRIVKVSATASTNTYLREFCRGAHCREEVLLWTDHQFAGRGQRGAFWESEPFKNLTFSVFKQVRLLSVDKQFYITMAASLAISEWLESLGLKRIRVKWPNDILAGNRKICGILIERVIKNGALEAIIIGVGLNVNQTNFKKAPRATSIQLETGFQHDLEMLIKDIHKLFDRYVNLITQGDFDQIKADYEAKLYKKNKIALFSDGEQTKFNGMIKGVSNEGELILQREDDSIATYRHKELKMHY
ncbi:MAG: biotin--[acetyl-CoA-carboxylase] ligase [Leeuwenhoekiella sp.]